MARVYVRRFDWDEAARLRSEGMPVAEIAARYGVTPGAVYVALSPAQRARQIESARRWRADTCEDCGGPAMRLVGGKRTNNPDGRTLCLSCRGKVRRSAVTLGDDGAVLAVKCVTCHEWKTPESYGRGARYHDLRDGGFHKACRPCQTKLRRDYRERRKVPCTRCGAPCLPVSEKGPRGVDSGLCLACWHSSRKATA